MTHPYEALTPDAVRAVSDADPLVVEAALCALVMLGDDAVAGPFLGRDGWARLSETWIDPDLSEPELCFELADRLATYVEAVEAVRRAD